MIKFDDLTDKELWQLRNEIVLNSCMVADYENSFGFDANSMSNFFDGYVDYLFELASEKYVEPTFEIIFNEYDNMGNLWDWYNCYDDFSWIKYNEEEN